MKSNAYRHLRSLAVGDVVPSELYVLDYRDGTRPEWTVHQVEELPSGARHLTLVDKENTDARDLFGPCGVVVALEVITSPRKTLRSQPHALGSAWDTLCDLEQQGRYVARGVAA